MNRVAWVVAVLVASWAGAALATVVEWMDVPELVAASERVVRGRVVASRAGWDASGMRIMTRHRVQVLEGLKGAPVDELLVESAGGVVGDVGQRVAGEADLRPGDDVVLFLERVKEGDREMLRVAGLAQGCWQVAASVGGAPVVQRRPSQLALVKRGATAGPRVFLQDAGAPAEAWTAFSARVRALARETR